MQAVRLILSLSIIAALSACASKPAPKKAPATQARSSVQPVRITHINPLHGSQELMLNSMGLIGTPYKYGGTDTSTGFDCSGMIQFVYKNALGVNLPRTARDLAAASRSIDKNQLKAGDLVFYNTGSPYSHVGLYIGNGEFIHAPSSRGTIRTEKMSNPYFAKRFNKAGTFF